MLPRSAALYIGVVQFFFATTWTVYAIYLPQLAERAGIGREWVPWILLTDQAIFAVTDVVTGFWVDRVRAGLARLGGWMLALTAVSCIAFMLLPAYGTSPGALLGLVFIWAITSAALRSPPWILLSRYAAKPSLPWLATLMLTGTAVAAAIAPYLGITLRNIDPRLPFAISNLTLLAAVGGLVWVERRLAGEQPKPASAADRTFNIDAADARRLVRVFFIALLVLAIGYQVHYSLNSAKLYRRFVDPESLAYLMPVFWIGFNVVMVLACGVVKRTSAVAVMTVGAAIGAIGTLWAVLADSAQTLVAAQFIAGGGWGAMNVGMFTAATAFGRSGREGRMIGTMFAMLSAAALVRIGAYASDLVIAPGMAEWLPWVPQLAWLGGAVLLGGAVATARRYAV